MGIKQDIMKAWAIMRHPGVETAWDVNPRDIIKFYYKIAVFTTALAIIVGIGSYYGLGKASTATTFYSAFVPLFGGSAAVAIAVYSILYFIVMGPAFAAIDSLLFHGIGKLIRQFKMPVSKTFVASIMSLMPALLFGWLLMVPVLGLIVDIVVIVWTIALLIFALSRQQRIDAANAFVVWLVTGLIVGVIVVVGVVLAFMLGAFNLNALTTSTAQSSICVAAPGYYCGTPYLYASTGQVGFAVGQDTGQTIYNVTVSLSPQNTTFTQAGFPTAISQAVNRPYSMLSGQISSVQIGIPKSYIVNGRFIGSVWLNYSTTQGGPATTAFRLATISVAAR